MLLDMHSAILHCLEISIRYDSSVNTYNPMDVEGTASIFFKR